MSAGLSRHFETMFGQDRAGGILVRGDKTGYENDAVQPVHVGNFFRQTKMSYMWRIEGSTE